MNSKILSYFSEQEISTSQLTEDQIVDILQEKDRTIRNLSEQLTKQKCQQVKNSKLIKTLQDKISSMTNSSNNTSSSFMMASQFKGQFQEFMSTQIANTFGDVIQHSSFVSKVIKDIFMYEYEEVSIRFNEIVQEVLTVLKIEPKEQVKRNSIIVSILKHIQNNHQLLFPQITSSNSLHYQENSQLQQDQKQVLTKMNKLFQSDEFRDMMLNLHKICIFMILQQKKIEFDFLEDKSIKFIKKEMICVDGWVKQGKDALIVFNGLKKQGSLLQNYKKYVLPINQNDSFSFSEKIHLKKKRLELRQVSLGESVQMSMPLKQKKQKSTNILEKSTKIKKSKENKSFEDLLSNKQNNPNFCNKKSKKKSKQTQEESFTLTSNKSPKYQTSKRDKSVLKAEQDKHKLFEEKLNLAKQQISIKKNCITLSNKIASNFSIQETMALKQRRYQQMPVAKDVASRKKLKLNNTSRKNSAGKIVNQNTVIKQFEKQSKVKNKEKYYKDLIKQKILQDKSEVFSAVYGCHHKSKSQRQKKKEQNRPLKIVNNASKLREKYLL